MNEKSSFAVGFLLTYVVVVILLFDGAVQVLGAPFILQALEETGFPPDAGPVLGIVTLTCALVLAIPRTAVLGAILVTGFLGGAIAVHLRLGEIGSPPQLICVLIGTATWVGLYVRDERLRALLPLRRQGKITRSATVSALFNQESG